MALDELRVWVEGDERVVRGVNENTTCENVMIALASAIGKSGKFALLEKWRNFERTLPRTGKPLKCRRMWGAHEDEAKFILKDDSNSDFKRHVVKSLKHETNDSLTSRDLFQTPYRYSSLETLRSIQAKRFVRLARDLEILKHYSECFKGEKLTGFSPEEIISDSATKFDRVVKLQLKELLGDEDCKQDLERQKNLNLSLTAKLEAQRKKIRVTNVHASDLDCVSEKLYLILVHNRETKGEKKIESSPGEKKPQDTKSSTVETQQEISGLKQQIRVQTELHCKQCEELEGVTRSIKEIDQNLEKKRKKLKLLQKRLDSHATFYDLDENFDPDKVEESIVKFDVASHSQLSQSQRTNSNFGQTNNKQTELSLLSRDGQRKLLSPPRTEFKKGHTSRAGEGFRMSMETEAVYV